MIKIVLLIVLAGFLSSVPPALMAAITGSVANISVVERAASEGVAVTFGESFRIGLPVTVATIVAGSLWLWATM